MADELNNMAGVGGQPSSTPSPDQVPSQDVSQSSAVPGAQTGMGGVPGGSAGQPTTAEQQAMTVRDALANYGYDVRSHFQDDHAALQHMVGLIRQAQADREYVQHGREFVQHADQFRLWQRQQAMLQQQRQAQSQQPQQWWKAPEYDPKWQQQITRDPQTGELRAIPGAPHDVVQKYLAFHQHAQEFQTKFAQDPIAAIKPGLEQLVEQKAQQLINQHFGQFQEQTTANSFVAQNAEWLYERNQAGQIATDARGQRVFTPLGRRFVQHATEAVQLGIQGSEQQQSYAMRLLERDYLMAQRQAASQQQQAQPQQQVPSGNPANAAYLARAQAQAQPAGVQGNTNGSYQQPNGLSQRGLAEMMMKEMQQAGYQAGQVVLGSR